MYDHIVEKVQALKPGRLTDEEVAAFIGEAERKAAEDGCNGNDGIAIDDLLLYYVLSQIALFSGDLGEYGNYSLLYNNAVTAYRRKCFEASSSESGEGYRNVW